MNYFDYLIGLGLGVVITLILRAVSDARREKQEALEEKERLHRLSHHEFDRHKTDTKDEFWRYKERFKVIVDRLDKLEAKKK